MLKVLYRRICNDLKKWQLNIISLSCKSATDSDLYKYIFSFIATKLYIICS